MSALSITPHDRPILKTAVRRASGLPSLLTAVAGIELPITCIATQRDLLTYMDVVMGLKPYVCYDFFRHRKTSVPVICELRLRLSTVISTYRHFRFNLHVAVAHNSII